MVWKKEVLIPIHKKRKFATYNNFRRLSLLCEGCKIYEMTIEEKLRTRIEDSSLGDTQAGFRAMIATQD